MARPTYKPSPEERRKVREFILARSGYNATGQPLPESIRDEALYPKGFTSFAKKAGISYRALSNVLNGHGPCTEFLWSKIQCEMKRDSGEYLEALIASIAHLTGKEEERIERALSLVLD